MTNNFITYVHIDKVTLHDRSNDNSSFSHTLEIVGGTEEGILMIGVTHNSIALRLYNQLSNRGKDIQHLKVSGELKTRQTDKVAYWLINDFEFSKKEDEDECKELIIYQNNNSHHDSHNNSFEGELRNLLEGGQKVPLIFYFNQAIKIDGLMPKESDQLLTICSLNTLRN